MLQGFGTTEEVISETVEETTSPKTADTMKLAIGVGAVAFIGVGLLWGMARASGPGAHRYRWGGI